ncbi:MAG TPA: hypothetical protein VF670_17570 [Duganella sp.]|jgi:hypothetical protein
MIQNLQQVNITVTLIDEGVALYTYFDPITGELNILVPQCVLKLDNQTVCLFALDAGSCKAGWSITQILPNMTVPIPYEMGPYGLSVGTMFDNAPATGYQFFIVYYNKVTNATYFIDPQEANVPPGTDLPLK